MKAINIPDIPARQLVGWTLAVTAVMACFWLLWRFQDVLLLLVTTPPTLTSPPTGGAKSPPTS